MQITKSQIPNTPLLDIHERIYQFVLRVIALTKVLDTSPQNMVIINQLIRSATSIGANTKKQMELNQKRILLQNILLLKKKQKKQIIGFVLLAIPIPN